MKWVTVLFSTGTLLPYIEMVLPHIEIAEDSDQPLLQKSYKLEVVSWIYLGYSVPKMELIQVHRSKYRKNKNVLILNRLDVAANANARASMLKRKKECLPTLLLLHEHINEI